jgi:hypothetical protein
MTAPWLQTETPPPRVRPANRGQRGGQTARRTHRLVGATAGEVVLTMDPAPEPPYTADHHAVHCPLVAVDIAGFGDPRRDDQVQLYVRNAMYQTLRTAFDGAGIRWQHCFRQDRGDGVLMVLPPGVPMAVLVDPLVDLVRAGLRVHNKMSSEAAQIRLRMALHAGSVLFDSHGVIGHSLTRLFNLLEAPVFKNEFGDATTELGLVISEYVYDDVIRHCSGRIDAGAYEPIEVAEEDRAARAWVYMPPGPSSRARTRMPRLKSTTGSAAGLREKVRDIARVAQ